MSVRRWKQVITITVILIIITAITTGVVFASKYFNLQKQEGYVPELVEAVKAGNIDFYEYKNLVDFFKNTDTAEAFAYKSKYPDLFVENDYIYDDTQDKKICYLTFDDGPDPYVTPQILDILKEYDIKATFFVVYNGSEEAKAIYKRIVDEGHTIGLHTASHDYESVYTSVEAFLDDFNKISEYVEETAGVKAEIFRFPGGSVNTYNAAIHYELIAEMIRRGYTFYDWNVSAEDALYSFMSKDRIIKNVMDSSYGFKQEIVLLHDGPGHINTARALPEIIERMQAQGYEFAPLNKDVKPIVFS